MFDTGLLFEHISQLKKKGRCLSNNFFAVEEMKAYSKQPESMLLCNENAIALVCEDLGVTRLYFYLSDGRGASALRELMEQIPRRPVVADCVGRQAQVDALSQALCGAGFSVYAQMGRLRAGKTINCPDISGVGTDIYAIPEDVDEILDGLWEIFDPLVSHLPNRELLLKLIEQKLVVRLKKDGKIVAVICMKRVGKKGIYCYQVYVSPAQRKKGYSRLVFQTAVNCFRNCQPFTIWVEDSNTVAAELYHSFGFVSDGLRNTILIYR